MTYIPNKSYIYLFFVDTLTNLFADDQLIMYVVVKEYGIENSVS